jgi:hypothetical protein
VIKCNHPVPIKYRFLRKYSGCEPQERDYRDIVLGDIPFTPDPNCPSWEQGFNNEIKYGKLKREHQGSSSSCVGQGWSKYLEMLNLIETGEAIDLSARDIYSQIFLPNGGSYIREGAKIAVNHGNCREELMLSYENDKNPSEEFMRERDATEETVNDALIYRSKKFVHLDTSHPLNDNDWENVRQIIWQFGGFVSGYKRHCMYAAEYGLVNLKKAIKFVNSYGEGSDRWWIEGNSNPLYDITFLFDLPNPPDKINMKKLIGDNRDKKQYIEVMPNKLRWIFNETILNELSDAGIIDKAQVEWKDNLDGYEIGNPWAIIK